MQISLDNGDFEKAVKAAFRHLSDDEVYIKSNNAEGIVLFKMILRDIMDGKYQIVPTQVPKIPEQEPPKEEDK